MSRRAFICRDPSAYRSTDKILYTTWTAPTTKSGVPTGSSTGRTTFRVSRDLYDMADVDEVQDQISVEGYPSDRTIQFGSVALTWWTLLELTQADRDETPTENR